MSSLHSPSLSQSCRGFPSTHWINKIPIKWKMSWQKIILDTRCRPKFINSLLMPFEIEEQNKNETFFETIYQKIASNIYLWNAHGFVLFPLSICVDHPSNDLWFHYFHRWHYVRSAEKRQNCIHAWCALYAFCVNRRRQCRIPNIYHLMLCWCSHSVLITAKTMHEEKMRIRMR